MLPNGGGVQRPRVGYGGVRKCYPSKSSWHSLWLRSRGFTCSVDDVESGHHLGICAQTGLSLGRGDVLKPYQSWNSPVSGRGLPATS